MTKHPPKPWATPIVAATAVACAVTLAACGPEGAAPQADARQVSSQAAAPAAPARPAPRPAPAVQPAPTAVVSADTGTVTSIETLTRAGEPSGAGAVVGGLLGAALGNQVGGGDGRKVATAAGAVGGAVVGHRVEKEQRKTVVGYRVLVRMDDGVTRSFERPQLGDIAVGARVRVSGSTLISV